MSYDDMKAYEYMVFAYRTSKNNKRVVLIVVLQRAIGDVAVVVVMVLRNKCQIR